ncbi:MAG: BrnT family toxin [Gammaproteobacteria bacterium]|nr:BrnT family toxin [Gammaproteobacteria bacterium]
MAGETACEARQRCKDSPHGSLAPRLVFKPGSDYSYCSSLQSGLAHPCFLTLGRLSGGRLLVVSHAEDHNTIRIISAREATRHERKNYQS